MNYLKKSNLLREPKRYRLPNDYRIEFLLEEYGYDYFLPKTLFYQLIQASVNNIAIVNKSNVKDDFDRLNVKLLKTIPYHIYNGSPVEKAIQILQDLSGGVDFRLFEGRMPCIGKSNNCKNKLEDLEDCNLQLAIKTNFKDYKVDSDALEKLYKYLDFIKDSFSDFESIKKSEVRDKIQMSSYGQILGSNITELAKPDFNIKLVRKKLDIKKYKTTTTKEDKKIILIIDSSGSMNSSISQIFSTVYFLYSKKIVLDLYLINASSTEAKLGLTPEQLFDFFRYKFMFTCGHYEDFSRDIHRIISTYKNMPKEVIIITDGAEGVKPKKLENTKITILNTSKYNKECDEFSKINKGKYLILK